MRRRTIGALDGWRRCRIPGLCCSRPLRSIGLGMHSTRISAKVGSMSMSFCFLIKAVVIHICLVSPTVLPVTTVYVAGELITSHLNDCSALLPF